MANNKTIDKEGNFIVNPQTGNLKMNSNSIEVKDLSWSFSKSEEDIIDDIRSKLKNVNTEEEIEDILDDLEDLEEKINDSDSDSPNDVKFGGPDPDKNTSPVYPNKTANARLDHKTKTSEEVLERMRDLIDNE